MFNQVGISHVCPVHKYDLHEVKYHIVVAPVNGLTTWQGCSFVLAGKLECKGNSRRTVKHDLEGKLTNKHVLEGKKLSVVLDYWGPKAAGSCYYALFGSPFPSKSCLRVRSSMKAEPHGSHFHLHSFPNYGSFYRTIAWQASVPNYTCIWSVMTIHFQVSTEPLLPSSQIPKKKGVPSCRVCTSGSQME